MGNYLFKNRNMADQQKKEEPKKVPGDPQQTVEGNQDSGEYFEDAPAAQTVTETGEKTTHPEQIPTTQEEQTPDFREVAQTTNNEIPEAQTEKEQKSVQKPDTDENKEQIVTGPEDNSLQTGDVEPSSGDVASHVEQVSEPQQNVEDKLPDAPVTDKQQQGESKLDKTNENANDNKDGTSSQIEGTGSFQAPEAPEQKREEASDNIDIQSAEQSIAEVSSSGGEAVLQEADATPASDVIETEGQALIAEQKENTQETPLAPQEPELSPGLPVTGVHDQQPSVETATSDDNVLDEAIAAQLPAPLVPNIEGVSPEQPDVGTQEPVLTPPQTAASTDTTQQEQSEANISAAGDVVQLQAETAEVAQSVDTPTEPTEPTTAPTQIVDKQSSEEAGVVELGSTGDAPKEKNETTEIPLLPELPPEQVLQSAVDEAHAVSEIPSQSLEQPAESTESVEQTTPELVKQDEAQRQVDEKTIETLSGEGAEQSVDLPAQTPEEQVAQSAEDGKPNEAPPVSLEPEEAAPADKEESHELAQESIPVPQDAQENAETQEKTEALPEQTAEPASEEDSVQQEKAVLKEEEGNAVVSNPTTEQAEQVTEEQPSQAQQPQEAGNDQNIASNAETTQEEGDTSAVVASDTPNIAEQTPESSEEHTQEKVEEAAESTQVKPEPSLEVDQETLPEEQKEISETPEPSNVLADNQTSQSQQEDVEQQKEQTPDIQTENVAPPEGGEASPITNVVNDSSTPVDQPGSPQAAKQTPEGDVQSQQTELDISNDGLTDVADKTAESSEEIATEPKTEEPAPAAEESSKPEESKPEEEPPKPAETTEVEASAPPAEEAPAAEAAPADDAGDGGADAGGDAGGE